MRRQAVPGDGIASLLVAAVNGQTHAFSPVRDPPVRRQAMEEKDVTLLETVAHPAISQVVDDLETAGAQGRLDFVDPAQV